ncbi:glycosyltransferase [Fonticella tunisiensis]|uniref:Glycosyl transferase family 28 n=1 Tax=Fonticella tunisiensis TaxID=1096341 RepID=A0A4R7K4K3_9CLOT|nr:glycosyltransferase [Fonticella tunisiensis]TDT46086.1 glycosyl transferase family 28 [Fonticella tunisiensis]
MKTIAFYISNHGFGHAARNIPIIQNLLLLDRDLKIIVKTHTRQLEFIKQSLSRFSSRIAYYDEYVDLGLILKENSYLVDKEKLDAELKGFISTWEDRIEKETSFIKENKIDLIVSDVVPWIFQSAKKSGVRSVLISNFTWAEIYKELFDSEVVNIYEDSYRKADYAFIFPLAGDIGKYFKNTYEVGLSSREFNEEPVKYIKNKYKRPIVFVSLGRSVEINDEIEVEHLPYDFIYTEGIKLRGNNTYKLPVDTGNTQDYIKASEIIITKAGWSTISESICAQRPILVLNRPEIKEDVNTINNLLNLKIANTIEFNQLDEENLSILIEETKKLIENYRFLPDRYKNSSKEIASSLLKLSY